MGEQFKVGDVVQLKSGSLRMTVEEIDNENDAIFCVWFEGNQPQRSSFPPATLKKAQNPSAGISVVRG